MEIIEISTNEKLPTLIKRLNLNDFKALTKKRYFFDWKKEAKEDLYKLCLAGEEDILGLMSIEVIPEEWRVHIRLLTVSLENMGKNKKYDRIAGNLISFAAKIAVENFAELACLSLRPKRQLAKHYIEKYNMSVTGMTLSIEVPEILALISEYDDEKNN